MTTETPAPRTTPLEVRLLWIATLAAMAASWTHLASWIASWEYAGASSWIIAAIASTAVDLGILASMRSLDVLASRGEDATGPRRTVYMLAFVSFAANVLHALDARATRIGALADDAGWPDLATRLAGAVLVAGVLPLIVVRLSHLLDRMTRLDAGSAVTRKAPVTQTATHPRRMPWAGWLARLRGTTQGATQGVAPTPATQDAPMTQASDAPNDAPRDAAGSLDDAPAAATATQDDAGERDADAGGDKRGAVRDAAKSSPRASRRELARLAKVSDATVRRLERDGVVTWTDAGWSAAARTTNQGATT